MIRPVQTSSAEWLGRHRAVHARSATFGTHAHPYLMQTVEALAARCAGAEKPSLLDYGCGKGVFLRAMERSGRFGFLRGYDPAIEAFKARPAQRYDLVLCLDVLDQIEDAFVDAVIADVEQFTRRAALFDVITVQTPALAHLNPRSAAQWEEMIGRRMRVTEAAVRRATEQELSQGACPERVIVTAEPSGRTGPA